ncbi:MAG TPA: ATP-binding protein [Fimbriimonadaceae bacterium]|jgi:hypothetical protein
MNLQIRPAERAAIVQSLKSGVVPRIGLQHFQVGRKIELENLLQDVEAIAAGGTAFRFIIGDYGSGKTFLLTLARTVAHKQKLVTAHADLNPSRRLQATGGQSRSLHAELMRNLSTQSRPEGAALPDVIERFVGSARDLAERDNRAVEEVIAERLSSLKELVNGYDFATVILKYWEGFNNDRPELRDSAIRWLRAEYSTKTEARIDLGVRTIIDDDNVYDMLKLFARFVRLSGYSGLLICLDELVNIYKLGNTQARNGNYEQILRMLNDSLQGSAEGMGFFMGGTPVFLIDPRRGAYSYEALASRLAANPFAKDGLVDYSGPVIKLGCLTAEDMCVLLLRLRNVYAGGDESKYLVTDEALDAFMVHCYKKIGEASYRTPRNTIIEFLNLLSVLEQNPAVTWEELIDKSSVSSESNPDQADVEEDDDLRTVRL